MTVKKIILHGKEDFSKIVGEVLRSLKVKEVADNDTADVDDLEITNEIIGRKVITRIKFTAYGEENSSVETSIINLKERYGAEVNRLVKRNLYLLILDAFGLEPVPYGILHGVRPTKIVQRWIDEGFGVTRQGVADRGKISRRIAEDFLTDIDKASLLTEVSVSQLPIIRTGGKKIVSVYIGIPFCKTRCLYCSFPSFVLPKENKVAEFMTTLTKDIEAAAEEIKRYGFRVQTIYIGGGTPTALPEQFFAEMLEKVSDKFNGAGVEEFTVECGRPDTITAEKIAALKKFGVTRVSVNPQTMHQRTLDFIGRCHTVEDVTRAFNELRSAGDWKINMDLIIGLPGERLADFQETLTKVLELAPDDVTIHSLAIKRGSKLQMNLADDINRPEDFDLPEDEEVRAMADYAAKILRGKNYLPYYLYRQGYMSGQIENIGWCRRGAESIYNVQIMSERQTIIGVGAAASSKVPDNFARKLLTAFNAKDLTTYLRDIDKYIANRSNILAQVYLPK
ncbi:MAG: coproporphyrinogen dehydrogenase HemZ [Selenomonadaceae bacterium]|nr:coproporphyrinogen dehydrogenase HemZ [Selenomonadaceae bacterium]